MHVIHSSITALLYFYFFSITGSRRRATKNHKSKAELLNPEEGEGDLAVGKIHALFLSLSLTHIHTYSKANHRNIQMLSYLAYQHYLTLLSIPLLPSPSLSCPPLLCTSLLMLHLFSCPQPPPSSTFLFSNVPLLSLPCFPFCNPYFSRFFLYVLCHDILFCNWDSTIC